MEDHEIVALYWDRDENSIAQTQRRYGGYLYKIAFQILADRLDSEESVNETYWRAWNSIPPHRPGVLRTWSSPLKSFSPLCPRRPVQPLWDGTTTWTPFGTSRAIMA